MVIKQKKLPHVGFCSFFIVVRGLLDVMLGFIFLKLLVASA